MARDYQMKTTLITGASSGIGEAFARRLARDGWNVLLVARTESKLEMLCSELGRASDINAQYVALDLTDTDAPAKLFEETKARGLEVEMLINNAGFGSMGDFLQLDLERELEMVDLNIKALVALTYLFLGPMRERGRGSIINVASTAGFQPVPYMTTYAATKAFVLSFSDALWEENRAYGVSVMALCPGGHQLFRGLGDGAPADARLADAGAGRGHRAQRLEARARPHHLRLDELLTDGIRKARPALARRARRGQSFTTR